MAVTVDCPTCGKKIEWVEKNTFRPFCSLRCKQNDLSAWATEQYIIPASTDPTEIDITDEDGANSVSNNLPNQ